MKKCHEEKSAEGAKALLTRNQPSLADHAVAAQVIAIALYLQTQR
jgi:hypothetical protein